MSQVRQTQSCQNLHMCSLFSFTHSVQHTLQSYRLLPWLCTSVCLPGGLVSITSSRASHPVRQHLVWALVASHHVCLSVCRNVNLARGWRPSLFKVCADVYKVRWYIKKMGYDLVMLIISLKKQTWWWASAGFGWWSFCTRKPVLG